ncbi:MAG: methyltransferase domain-containing protein [Gammaproteobacteria bacterium]
MSPLNNKRVRQAFARAAAGFSAADFFHREIRERLLERLDWVKLDPEVVLDLGAGNFESAADLQLRYPKALLVGLDISEAMLRAADQSGGAPLAANAEHVPLKDQSAELVISNLLLHWAAHPERAIAESSRVLKISGLFSFTMLGPGSFNELRSAWAEVDDYQHVHDFEDMHNIGDALIKSGLQDPVMDSEVLTVTYANLDKLVRDLRGIGGTNHAAGARPGLTTRRAWEVMGAALDRFRNAEGRIEITLEIVYGHAWKLHAERGISSEEGVVNFPLERLRRGITD